MHIIQRPHFLGRQRAVVDAHLVDKSFQVDISPQGAAHIKVEPGLRGELAHLPLRAQGSVNIDPADAGLAVIGDRQMMPDVLGLVVGTYDIPVFLTGNWHEIGAGPLAVPLIADNIGPHVRTGNTGIVVIQYRILAQTRVRLGLAAVIDLVPGGESKLLPHIQGGSLIDEEKSVRAVQLQSALPFAVGRLIDRPAVHLAVVTVTALVRHHPVLGSTVKGIIQDQLIVGVLIEFKHFIRG